MKVLTVTAPHNAVYETTEKPVPTGKMMLVKVKNTGICATDLSIFTGESSFVKSGQITYPVRFGHEWSGEVEAVGEEVTSFKPGDHVVSDSGISCGVCPMCEKGAYADCPHIRSVGTINAWEGCYAEYMLIPEFNAYHVPEGVSFEEAALIEPTAISLDAFTNFEVTPETTVCVVGIGAIGMGAIWLSKYFGAKTVIAVGRNDKKLAIAKEIGADVLINTRAEDAVEAVKRVTDGKGADLVIEAAGTETTMRLAMQLTKNEGRLSIVSFFEKDITLPIDEIVIRCIMVRGAAGRFGYPGKVAEIMAKHPVKLTPIITHRVPFENCLDMFENEEKYHNEKVKVLVTF